MSAPMVIGNQLILEEDFDENYIPSDQDIREYAMQIGIDLDNETELMWLAREGIVAPLPPEWKPCQDVTGEIYYYNFSSGDSTWDHPCDEHYRGLVIQERERNQRTAAAGSSGPKKKKKTKEKKDKKKKDSAKSGGPGSTLRSLPPPLGSLASLSGLDAPVLGPISGSAFPRSLGSGGLEPLKASPGPLGVLRSSGATSVLSSKKEEKVYLTVPGFDDADENESSQQSSDWELMNLHLDMDDLKAGIQYEDSDASAVARAEERTEPEMQDISGGQSSEPPSRQDSLGGHRVSPLAVRNLLSEAVIEGGEAFEEREDKKQAQDKYEEADEKSGHKKGDEGDIHQEQGGGHGTLENEQRESSDDESEKKGKGDGGGIDFFQDRENWENVVDKDGRPEKRVQHDEICDREMMECAEVMEKKDLQEKEECNNLIEHSQNNDTDMKESDHEGVVHKIIADDYGGQDGGEEENGESHADLERCSLSQRKLTDDEDEVLESCVASDRETQWERKEFKDESDGQKAESASLNEEETMECFEMETAQSAFQGKKATLGALKVCHQKRKPGKMDSVNNKAFLPAEMSEKVLDLNDLSGPVSPFEDNDAGDVEDEMDKYIKGEVAKRHLQPADKDKSSPEVDRLVVHHSSVQNQQTATGRSSALNLHRPETSRGRLSRTSSSQINDAETTIQNYVTPLEKESNFGIWKNEKEEESELRKTEKEKSQKARSREEDRQSGNAIWGVEESKEQIMGEKNSRLFHLQETISREEEDEKECLKREKEERISFLIEELKREEEAEKDQLMQDKERRKCLLQEELRSKEQEEEKLREESEEKLRALKQHLLSKRQEEEVKLNKESHRMLEALKESALKEREKQLHELREESEAMLKELRITLEEEKAAERDRLEGQKRLDIERLKAESEEKLQAEKEKLQEEKLNPFKQELKRFPGTERRRELIGPGPEQQLTEYHRELSDLLLEVREEVQRDHEKKLEQLREEHRRELNIIREKQLEEESIQRDRFLTTQQFDRDHLQASHALQLERLRKQLDSEIEKAQLTHSHRESELKDLISQLELRAKELKREEEMLYSKTADLKRKRKILGEEEEDVDKRTGALHKVTLEREQLKLELERMREEQSHTRELLRVVREERNEARQEEERLTEERDKVREEGRKAKEQKERLESKVALLEERCNRLSRRVSELEICGGCTIRQNMDKNKVMSPPSGHRDSSLHVNDLEDPLRCTVPDSNGDNIEFGGLNSSIQKTKIFLEKESNRLMQRQTLHVAQSNSTQQSKMDGRVTPQTEARNVSELQEMVKIGNPLNCRKEQLKQLDSSIAEESFLQGASLLAGERKVTFNVTDSDLSSTVDAPDVTGGSMTFLAKVQELAESQQQISGQLNTVLGALGSLAQKQSNTSLPGFPATLSHSTPAASASPTTGPTSLGQPNPLWKSSTQGGSGTTTYPDSSITSGLRSSEDVTLRRWREIFPEAAALNSITLRTYTSHASYTPASLHVQKSVKVDGRRLQKLIDSNKRWLEMRKKDSSIPLFTRYQASSSQSNLVQLGLDDKDQIRVYHY
ncbi:centrosomal protein of 164 kDa-like isoform X1 [Phyllopteryx taeniolatus]|uniref:centrosomal protein of 164 kDa-like isoform X1 n=2 Tax=Phyllopteryx taeniolatus TaxID=161469 RepID=UPI002AD1F653|nr:centrosomal protein of 164 kDa-like isoform X1 [Phyllopteryx taeniolatus]